MCVCVCVVIPFILDVRLVGRTSQGHTGGSSHSFYHPHLPSAVLAFIFIARRIKPFISLVDCEFEFCVLLITSWAYSSFLLSFFCEEKSSSCDRTEIRTHVPTSEGFEVTN